MGKRMVILAWSLQREKKVLLRKENPVGPGTEVSPTASKRQHAGGGEVDGADPGCNCSYCTY